MGKHIPGGGGTAATADQVSFISFNILFISVCHRAWTYCKSEFVFLGPFFVFLCLVLLFVFGGCHGYLTTNKLNRFCK